jgi:uncharacterized membrane protein
MIMGSTIMVGSLEIPEQLPGLIDTGLAGTGTAWPAIEGLDRALGLVPPPGEADDQPSQTNPEVLPPATALGRVMIDPLGNSLAIIVLIGLVLSTAYVGLRFTTPSAQPFALRHPWLVPLLCLTGIGVAAYMTYVETSGSAAVCGPIGDCNAVQTSPYAFLFGVIPVGGLGLFGFAAMLVSWFIGQQTKPRIAQWGYAALFGMAFLGTLFSIYLTFLEPFVIGATCAWCLASAIVIALLMLLSRPLANRPRPAAQ